MDRSDRAPRWTMQWVGPLLDTPLLPSYIMIPVLVLLGIGLFLVGGFADLHGGGQPFPIYIFLGILFMVIQSASLATKPELQRRLVLLYVLGTDIAGLVLAGDAVLNPSPLPRFTQLPQTYYVIHFVALGVFIANVVSQFRQRAAESQTSTDSGQPSAGARFFKRFPYDALASDLAGLALTLLFFWWALTFLGSHYFCYGTTGFQVGATPLHLTPSGPQPNPPIISACTKQPVDSAYVSVPLGFGFGYLEVLDLFLVPILAASAVVLAGIYGAMRAFAPDGTASRDTPGSTSFLGALGGLLGVMYHAVVDVMRSLRFVLGPIAWFLAAAALASASQVITTAINNHFLTFTDQLQPFQLLWPFHTAVVDSQRLTEDLQVLVGMLAAIVATGFSVAFLRLERAALLDLSVRIARAGALVYPFFAYTLAFINVALALRMVNQRTYVPFQVDYSVLVAIAVIILIALSEYLISRLLASRRGVSTREKIPVGVRR